MLRIDLKIPKIITYRYWKEDTFYISFIDTYKRTSKQRKDKDILNIHWMTPYAYAIHSETNNYKEY